MPCQAVTAPPINITYGSLITSYKQYYSQDALDGAYSPSALYHARTDILQNRRQIIYLYTDSTYKSADVIR